jgi:hypothetical protein
MTTNAGHRLAKVEAALRARLVDEPGIIIVFPDDWTAADRVRYAAGGEWAADVIEKRTGLRPGATTILIAMAERPDGPQ